MRLQSLCAPLCLALVLVLTSACSDSSDKGKDSRVPDKGAVGDSGHLVDQGQHDSSVDGSAGSLATLVPQGNAVSGWIEDTAKDGVTGPNVAYTKEDIEGIIDGENDPYHALGCDGFAEEYYIRDFDAGCKGKIELKLWDMAASTGAEQMYTTKKQTDENDSHLTFETIPDVQTAAVIAWASPAWKVHAYKGEYVLKMRAEITSSAATCKDAVKADAIAWAKKITEGLP